MQTKFHKSQTEIINEGNEYADELVLKARW